MCVRKRVSRERVSGCCGPFNTRLLLSHQSFPPEELPLAKTLVFEAVCPHSEGKPLEDPCEELNRGGTIQFGLPSPEPADEPPRLFELGVSGEVAAAKEAPASAAPVRRGKRSPEPRRRSPEAKAIEKRRPETSAIEKSRRQPRRFSTCTPSPAASPSPRCGAKKARVLLPIVATSLLLPLVLSLLLADIPFNAASRAASVTASRTTSQAASHAIPPAATLTASPAAAILATSPSSDALPVHDGSSSSSTWPHHWTLSWAYGIRHRVIADARASFNTLVMTIMTAMPSMLGAINNIQ